MAWFKKVTDSLQTWKLSSKIKELFSSEKKENVALLRHRLRDLLILSDISVHLARSLADSLPLEVLSDSQSAVHFLKERLVAILKPAEHAFVLDSHSVHVVLMIGVNGVGKTTTIGKLAYWSSQAGLHVTVVSADTFRAAAHDQLKVWASRAQVDFVEAEGGKGDPASVVYCALDKHRDSGVFFVDTAGRLHNRTDLMDELLKVKRIIQKKAPDAVCSTILVLDAFCGSHVVQQARVFHEKLGLSGLIVTKTDGTAKGGGIIEVVRELSLPIFFACQGEEIGDLVPFSAERYVDRIFETEREEVGGGSLKKE